MTWRLLYVSPGAERKVVAAMDERKLTSYVPAEIVWRGKSAKRRKASIALIPRYVFADVDDAQLPVLGHLHGVSRFIGNASGPFIVPSDFIDALRSAEAAGTYDHTRNLKAPLRPGQSVRICRGPFQGVAAVIVKLTNERRAKVLTSIFGRSGSMAIDLDHLEAA